MNSSPNKPSGNNSMTQIESPLFSKTEMTQNESFTKTGSDERKVNSKRVLPIENNPETEKRASNKVEKVDKEERDSKRTKNFINSGFLHAGRRVLVRIDNNAPAIPDPSSHKYMNHNKEMPAPSIKVVKGNSPKKGGSRVKFESRSSMPYPLNPHQQPPQSPQQFQQQFQPQQQQQYHYQYQHQQYYQPSPQYYQHQQQQQQSYYQPPPPPPPPPQYYHHQQHHHPYHQQQPYYPPPHPYYQQQQQPYYPPPPHYYNQYHQQQQQQPYYPPHQPYPLPPPYVHTVRGTPSQRGDSHLSTEEIDAVQILNLNKK